MKLNKYTIINPSDILIVDFGSSTIRSHVKGRHPPIVMNVDDPRATNSHLMVIPIFRNPSYRGGYMDIEIKPAFCDGVRRDRPKGRYLSRKTGCLPVIAHDYLLTQECFYEKKGLLVYGDDEPEVDPTNAPVIDDEEKREYICRMTGIDPDLCEQLSLVDLGYPFRFLFAGRGF